jgi:hypothetical protein
MTEYEREAVVATASRIHRRLSRDRVCVRVCVAFRRCRERLRTALPHWRELYAAI